MSIDPTVKVDTLSLTGFFTIEGFTPRPDAGPRTNQLPLIGSVTAYPDLP